MLSKTFILTEPASTGNQVITGVGFQGKLLLVQAVNRGTWGDGAGAGWMFGAATSSTNRWVVSGRSDNGQAVQNSGSKRTSSNVIQIANVAGTNQAAADFVSWGSDGFTLNWSAVNDSSRQYICTVLGGSDFDAEVGQSTTPGSAGTQSVTGLSFQPNCLLLFDCRLNNVATGTSTFYRPQFGFFDDTGAGGGWGANSYDAADPTVTSRIQNTSNFAATASTDGGRDRVAALSSYNSDGFTLDWTILDATFGATTKYQYVAMRVPSAKKGAVATRTTTGNTVVSSLGHTPQLILLGGVESAQTSGTGDPSHNFAVGMVGGTGSNEQAVVATEDKDNLANSNTSSKFVSGKAINFISANGGSPTDDLVASVSAIDYGTFTLNYTTVLGSAMQVNYLSIGTASFSASSSFTINAIVKKNISSTKTLNAYIKKVVTGSFTINAIVYKSVTGSASLNAVVKANVSTSATLDAIVKKSFSSSFTINAVTHPIWYDWSATWSGTVSGGFTLDAVIKSKVNASATLNAVVKASRSSSFTVNAIAKKGFSSSFTANAIIKASASADRTLDAIIKAEIAQATTLDAVVKAKVSSSLTANAIVGKTLSGSATVDAYVLVIRTGSATLNAIVRAKITQTATLDAVVKKNVSTGATLNAIVKKNLGSSYTLNAIASVSRSQSITVDAVVKANVATSATFDAVVKASRSGSLTTNAIVRASPSTTVVLDGWIKTIRAGSLTLDALVSLTGVGTWTTPLNAETINEQPSLAFLIPIATGDMHFQIELDKVDTFDGGDYILYDSSVDQTGWEYWNGSTWTAVPADGVPNSFAGNEARLNVPTPLAQGFWYRRMRAGV